MTKESRPEWGGSFDYKEVQETSVSINYICQNSNCTIKIGTFSEYKACFKITESHQKGILNITII